MNDGKRFTLAFTGASGLPYGLPFLVTDQARVCGWPASTVYS